jgi:putative peptidoglycan lipid II flippase
MSSGSDLSSRRYLIDKTRVVLIWRGAGVASGFILDAAILAWFGMGMQTDAFFAALTIPFLIDGTISVQFTQVIVPMLAGVRQQEGEAAASAYLSNVITVWMVVVSMLAALAMMLSKLIMPLQVPGWTATATGMAANMNMILVWLVPPCGLAALLSGALYSLHRYWLSSSVKAINNLGILAFAVFAYKSLGIYALAVGYIIGAVLQCIVLWAGLARNGFQFRPRFQLRDPLLGETAKLVFYPLAGQMLGELRTVIENFCASFYAPGILSALKYSSRIIHALSGVLMSSVVTAVTPTVAHFMAGNQLDEMKKAIRSGIKLLLFLSLPVSLWLIFDGDKLMTILFERGKFSHADATLTGQLVALMTPYIFFSRAISITQTPFYAAKDTRTLVISMVLGFFLYVAVIPPLLYSLGYYGFPVATSLGTALVTVLMCWLARRSFGAMGWHHLREFTLRFAGVAVVTCVGFLVGNQFASDFGWSGFVGKCLRAGIPSFLGFAAFAAGTLVFRLANLDEISSQIGSLGLRRLRGLFPRSSLSPRTD